MYFLAKYVANTFCYNLLLGIRTISPRFRLVSLQGGICNWVVQIQLAKIQMIRIVYFEWLRRSGWEKSIKVSHTLLKNALEFDNTITQKVPVLKIISSSLTDC